MNLKKAALKAINTQETRLNLALALKVTEQTIIRYIKNNDDRLTKAAALKVIKEQTGLTEDEIFETVHA